MREAENMGHHDHFQKPTLENGGGRAGGHGV